MANGVIDVFAMRPSGDAACSSDVIGPEHAQLEVVAAFSMDPDQFIDRFGGLVTEVGRHERMNSSRGPADEEP